MRFFIGVDLGQSADYTAISVLKVNEEDRTGQIIHLQRLPLGMPYPQQVMEIRKLYEHILKFNEPVFLTVDNTGVGRPVLDLIREIGISPIGITITGGTEIRQDGDSLYVPKVEMITCLTVEFQTGKLKIIGTLPDSETIMKELAGFKRKQNIRTGHESFESWRDGIHDDLVLSVALPVWFCSWLMGQYCSIETFYYDDSAERRISSY